MRNTIMIAVLYFCLNTIFAEPYLINSTFVNQSNQPIEGALVELENLDV